MRKNLSYIMFCFLLVCGTTLYAGKISFSVTTNKPGAIYKPGEKITFRILLQKDGKPVVDKKLLWKRQGDDKKTVSGELESGIKPVEVSTSINSPGFVRLRITAYDKKSNKKVAKFDGGAGASPNKLRGLSEPADFDKFWNDQKRRLKKIPLKYKMTPITVKNPKLSGFDVKVDCAEGKPVSGYFFKPKNAAVKSLPAIITFHGYGVSGASRNEKFASKNMLSFDINAHGIANGKNNDFYKKLSHGELKLYGFKNNGKREKSYFLGMLLRVIRALDFIKAQPEWDGENLIVSGGSQAGFQALAAAGLDSQVSFCRANKPWLCDLGGIRLGRLKGWRPGYTKALEYFDPANHAKRIKCQTIIDIGLGDYVCPPSGVTVMYNNIKATKKLIYIQGATHGFTPRSAKKNATYFLDKHLNNICKSI
jgi:cephalosporin-C deacetylase-like acetyl esterase